MKFRPTNIFIYNLARDDLKMKAIEKIFLNLISLLHLLSFLYNLICVASVLSMQPRIKGKDWLAKNPDNVLPISDMFTR
jgi:hypothetical protein